MVIRKHDEADLRPIPPIPTQVVTNGEFVPLPKTQKQREVDLRLMEYADRYGTSRGLSRRRFLMTASGFAAAMLAMNKVYGREFFRVAEVEAADEAAAIEAQLKTRKGTQFIFDDQTHWLNAATFEHAKTERGKIVRDFLMGFRNSVLPNSKIQDIGTKVAYPMYDKARKLGIKTFCIRKGLAVIWFDEKYCRLHDLQPAALASQHLNFIIYHSGYPWVDDLANITWFKRNPALNVANNIYAELGSTFAMTVTGAPLEAAHVLGKLVTHVGSDRIMWGSDSTWWGSPQWQIDAFRRFQIPEDIQKGYGYKPITDKDKELILGLNAARVYGINVEQTMKQLAQDTISNVRAAIAPKMTEEFRKYAAAAGMK